jgi:hypothetical protein
MVGAFHAEHVDGGGDGGGRRVLALRRLVTPVSASAAAIPGTPTCGSCSLWFWA